MTVPTDEICATCFLWQRQVPSLASALRDPTMPAHLGRCARHPATVIPTIASVNCVEAHFPVTHEAATCGDYVPPFDDGPDPEREAVEPEAANVVKLERAA